MKIYLIKLFSVICLLLMCGNSIAGIDNLIDNVMGKSHTLQILLIDTTQSITQTDKHLYRTAALKSISQVKPGDRLVIARISHAPLGEFTVDADMSFTKSGRHFEDVAKLKKSTSEAEKLIDTFLNSPPSASKSTRILEVLTALSPLISEARSKKMRVKLLALTDAIEESPTVNMKNQVLSDTLSKSIIARQKEQSLLPDLMTVEVYFVGGSGSTPVATKAIEKFWRSFVAASKGDVVFYGRTIPDFTP